MYNKFRITLVLLDELDLKNSDLKNKNLKKKGGYGKLCWSGQ
jgi:hypothetical protein